MPGRCEQSRACRRCSFIERQPVDHAWGDWEYEHSGRCSQVRSCRLCSKEEKRPTHHWSDWQKAGYCSERSCQRCGSVESELATAEIVIKLKELAAAMQDEDYAESQWGWSEAIALKQQSIQMEVKEIGQQVVAIAGNQEASVILSRLSPDHQAILKSYWPALTSPAPASSGSSSWKKYMEAEKKARR